MFFLRKASGRNIELMWVTLNRLCFSLMPLIISILLSGSGAIEFDEFVKMYLTLRTKPMDKGRTIKALFHKLDTDNDGHLGFR